tara:strand:- start:179 stop:397 length:219 start_codon:yes stop_codon:yes gene_type:complete
MNKRYCSIKELSEYTSLPIKTLYEWADQRLIPSIKIGRRVLIDLNDFDKIMLSLKRESHHENNIANKITGEI